MSLLVIPSKDNVTIDPVVVLELFTSQGCSSCPKADELLGDIKSNYASKNVIALSYHVDYWNYIGWKDPFSKKAFSDKQRAYGKKFYSSSIYTPQVVVNGEEHFVGSNKAKMQSKLTNYLKKTSNNSIVLNKILRDDNTIEFTYKIEGDINEKQLTVALVINERITSVNRGENRNRVLKNFNIVVEEIYVDATTEGKGYITIPNIVKKEDDLSLVALIQTEDLSITGGIQASL